MGKKGVMPAALANYWRNKYSRGGSPPGKQSRARSYLARAAHIRPSLVAVSAAAGIIFTLSGWGEKQRNDFYAAFQSMLISIFGAAGNIHIDGAVLFGYLIVLAIACALAPEIIGRPVNSFLGRFGMRL